MDLILPKSSELEAGDFLWPKKPSAFVPYSEAATDVSDDQRIWENEKRHFLERAERGELTSTADQLAEIRRMDYREFLARYNGDRHPGVREVYAAAGLYVGHVAIVGGRSDGDLTVIEALWGRTVERSCSGNGLRGDRTKLCGTVV